MDLETFRAAPTKDEPLREAMQVDEVDMHGKANAPTAMLIDLTEEKGPSSTPGVKKEKGKEGKGKGQEKEICANQLHCDQDWLQ